MKAATLQGVDWSSIKERTRAGMSREPSDSELAAVFAERAVALSRNVGAGADHDEGRTLLAFSHGAMSFAVEMESVVRIFGNRRISKIPAAPRHLGHLFYESGRIISAVSPSALFSNTDDHDDTEHAQRIVLLESSGAWLGILATRVFGPRAFRSDVFGKPSSSLRPDIAPCVRGIAEDLTVVLDGTALVEGLRQK